MPARIIDLATENDEGSLYETLEEAERALRSMIEKFKARNCSVEEEHLAGEDYPRYTVNDQNDQWIGTFTISD